jgi:benzoyl-CoA reductase/2-hydroxyglutaryl-CoA dehydratase subunit BcrC/BadD/HgdB
MALGKEEVVAQFEAVCADPYGTARVAAAQGVKVAGYMCTYVPEEILHAAGYFPIRVFGWSDGTQRADGLLQTFACSLARGALDAALSGRLDFLRLMVFGHTCDTLQNLADIWQRNVGKSGFGFRVSGFGSFGAMQHWVMATPVATSGEAATAFFTDELQRLRRFLEEEQGPISDAEIEESIDLYDHHRRAMRDLYALRRENPRCLTGREMLSSVLASFLMRKEDHLPLIQDLISRVSSVANAPAVTRNPKPETRNPEPRVFVIGSVCQSAEYMRAIEEAGCTVVDDALCTGARAFAVRRVAGGARQGVSTPCPSSGPIDALARMYLERAPCPAKHRPGYNMGADILEQARAAEADGVIFLLTKFCEPWAFDYPHVRETLEAASIPSLLIEIEQHLPPSAHFSTRVGAFAEMLRNRV